MSFSCQEARKLVMARLISQYSIPPPCLCLAWPWAGLALTWWIYRSKRFAALEPCSRASPFFSAPQFARPWTSVGVLFDGVRGVLFDRRRRGFAGWQRCFFPRSVCATRPTCSYVQATSTTCDPAPVWPLVAASTPITPVFLSVAPAASSSLHGVTGAPRGGA